jgi:hypothetical protein
MTAARHERKSQRPSLIMGPNLGGIVGASLLAAVAVLGWRAPPTDAATTERIVADHHTGLAISGFDPVAYFIEGRAAVGRPEFELRLEGVSWRFRNEGNRAAFAADPDVYQPRFGGYDPVAVARGASVPGHPEIWLVFEQRLYLFRSEETRDAFAENPERVIGAAEQRWPEVLQTLTP